MANDAITGSITFTNKATSTKLKEIKYADGANVEDVKILELDASLTESKTTIWRKPLAVTLNCSYTWEKSDDDDYKHADGTMPELSKELVLPYGTKLWVTTEDVLTDDVDAQTAEEKPYYGSDAALKSLILHIDYSNIAEQCKINGNPPLSFFDEGYKADKYKAIIIGAYECLTANKIDSNDKLGYIASIMIGDTNLADYDGSATEEKPEGNYYIVESDITVSITYKVRYREYRVAVGYQFAYSEDSYVCYDNYFELFGGQQVDFEANNPTNRQSLNENSSNNSIKGTYKKPTGSHTTKTGSSLGTTAGKDFTDNVETYLKPGTDEKPYRSEHFGLFVRQNTLSAGSTTTFIAENYDETRKCYFISYTTTDVERLYDITINGAVGKTSTDGLYVGDNHILYSVRASSTCSIIANQTSIDNESWLFSINGGSNVLFGRAAQPNMYTYNTVSTSTTSPESFRDIIGTNKALWKCQSGQSSWSFTPSIIIASNWANYSASGYTIKYYANNLEDEDEVDYFKCNNDGNGDAGYIFLSVVWNWDIPPDNGYIFVNMGDGSSGTYEQGTYRGYLQADKNNINRVSMKGKITRIGSYRELGSLGYHIRVKADNILAMALPYQNKIPMLSSMDAYYTKPNFITTPIREFYIKKS